MAPEKKKSSKKSPPVTPEVVTRAVIAREAGVSPGLISAFFSGTSYSSESPKGIGISPATRKRIKETCVRLNYIPKDPALFARIYPEKGDVAFMLSEHIPDGFANPYFSRALEGIARRAAEAEVSLQTFYFKAKHDYNMDTSKLPAPILSGGIKKVLITGGGTNYSLLIALQKMGVSIVQLSQSGEVPGVLAVVPDYYGGARLAIRKIHEAGHRNIAIVAEGYGLRNTYRGNLVFQGCLDEMKELGIPFKEKDIIVKATSGAEKVSSVLPKLKALSPFPSAIFCMHDWTAQMLIPLLQEEGYRIPDDLSVVGMDDDRNSEIMRPALSTIHVPLRQIGTQAFDELQEISRIGPPENMQTLIMPIEWMERETLRKI